MGIMVFALHKGVQMFKYLAGGIIYVEVLEGQIIFSTDEYAVE